MASRRPRQRPRREETRARVLESAVTVFTKAGISQSTLDDVAQNAGMTKGAVYSSFESKNALILAVVELMSDHVRERVGVAMPALLGGTEIRSTLRAMGRALAAEYRRDMAWHRLLAELVALSPRIEGLPELLQQQRDRARDAAGEAITAASQHLGVDLPMPLDDLATLVMALSNGLAIESDLSPAKVSDEIFGDFLVRMFAPDEPVE